MKKYVVFGLLVVLALIVVRALLVRFVVEPSEVQTKRTVAVATPTPAPVQRPFQQQLEASIGDAELSISTQVTSKPPLGTYRPEKPEDYVKVPGRDYREGTIPKWRIYLTLGFYVVQDQAGPVANSLGFVNEERFCIEKFKLPACEIYLKKLESGQKPGRIALRIEYVEPTAEAR